MLGWVLLDAQHPLAQLLAAVRKDEGMHHFIRALNNNVDATIAPRAFHMILRHVALATHDLQSVIDGAIAEFTAEHLAYRRLKHDVLVLAVKEAGGHEEHRFHGVGVRTHARKLLLDQVKLADRSLKLEAVLRPLRGLFVGKFCCAQHAGTQCAATVVQASQRNVQAATFLVQQVLLRNLDVGEPNARLPCSTDATL